MLVQDTEIKLLGPPVLVAATAAGNRKGLRAVHHGAFTGGLRSNALKRGAVVMMFV
jgi:hypothetical protein